MIIDLQAWLEEKVKTGSDIILAIDANEEYKSSKGTITPLSYNAGNHIINSIMVAQSQHYATHAD